MSPKAAAKLNAESRNDSGKGAARQLRRDGKVPAVMYGKDHKPVSLTLSANELQQLYMKGRFSSRVIDLSIDGGKEKLQALPRDVQTHPVTDKIEHVDFLKVDDNTIVKVAVPVKFLNTDRCRGVKKGGAINAVRHTIEFFCKPAAIPEAIEVNTLELEIGDSVHIEDISLPEGVTPTIDRNFTIVTVAGRGKQEDEEGATAEGAEGEAPAAEGAEGGEAASEGEDKS